ncbi:MAG: hypothetical protein LBQ83_04585, partial [Candidatus Margulisbacteria bacterium]|nr:hypothetical protein [Candidatus Margulisiibacteriota bacterium]
FRNPLREAFAQALKSGNYDAALELILILNFRKHANRKEITRAELDSLEKELSAAAGELRLDLEKLQKSFAADRPVFKAAYQPPENKVNITFKPAGEL